MKRFIIPLLLAFTLTAFAENMPDTLTMMNGTEAVMYITNMFPEKATHAVELTFFRKKNFTKAIETLNSVGCELLKNSGRLVLSGRIFPVHQTR